MVALKPSIPNLPKMMREIKATVTVVLRRKGISVVGSDGSSSCKHQSSNIALIYRVHIFGHQNITGLCRLSRLGSLLQLFNVWCKRHRPSSVSSVSAVHLFRYFFELLTGTEIFGRKFRTCSKMSSPTYVPPPIHDDPREVVMLQYKYSVISHGDTSWTY